MLTKCFCFITTMLMSYSAFAGYEYKVCNNIDNKTGYPQNIAIQVDSSSVQYINPQYCDGGHSLTVNPMDSPLNKGSCVHVSTDCTVHSFDPASGQVGNQFTVQVINPENNEILGNCNIVTNQIIHMSAPTRSDPGGSPEVSAPTAQASNCVNAQASQNYYFSFTTRFYTLKAKDDKINIDGPDIGSP